MSISDFTKAIKEENNIEAFEIGLKILASEKPYPKTLQQHVRSCLEKCFPSANLQENITHLNSSWKKQVSLIEKNAWTFDLSCYNTQTGKLFPSPKDAIIDYIAGGWERGLDPSPFFSTRFYLKYPDIANSGICPLVHYLSHGIDENRGTADPFEAMYRAADLIQINGKQTNNREFPRLGVFIHLYYADLASLFQSYLNNIPCSYDLYISTQHENVGNLLETFKENCNRCANIVVKSFPNIGRDVAPFFCGFGEYINQYDLVLKLHSKKSSHETALSKWLEHILDCLLGSPEIINTIITELTGHAAETNLVYPIETLEIMHAVAKDSCWGHDSRNYELANPILKKWNIKASRHDKFQFPAGTMFWCKSEILRPLSELKLSYSDFEAECGQIDGTLAHSIERLIGLSAAKVMRGKVKTSFLSWNTTKEGQKKIYSKISQYPIQISGFEKVYHYPSQDLDRNLTRPRLDEGSLDIHWVIPNFQVGAGGHMTIFRAVSYLERVGHKCTIWIHSLKGVDEGSTPSIYQRNKICSHFIKVDARVFLLGGRTEDLDSISGDVCIATDRMSVYPVLGMKNFLIRSYFIQDYEPSFFPVGSEYIFTKNTYSSKNKFLCICASVWLAQMMRKRYGNKSVSFSLAVDHKVYTPCNPNEKIDGQIAFYVRRSTPRRLFALGLLALHELYASGARFSLAIFGEDNTPNLNLPVKMKYLGVLSPDQLRNVYAQSHVGLVLSGTNYSLIPNEMMAVGLPVVDIDGDHTRTSYEADSAFLSEAEPKSIANNLKRLLEDKILWSKYFLNGQAAVKSLTWEKSFAKMNSAIVDSCIQEYANYPSKTATGKPLVSIVIPTYNGGVMLRSCIESALRQHTSFAYELIIIDSGSTDGSIEKIQNLKDVAVLKIPKATFGHGKTRNLGAKIAKGDYVAYLTQDAIPANQFWLRNLVQPLLEDREVAGVLGAHIAHQDHSHLTDNDLFNHFYEWIAKKHSIPIKIDINEEPAHVFDWQRFYSDNNSCLRRSVWESLPYPDVAYGEDQIWAETILKAGYKKAFAPMSIVYHSHEYGFRDTVLRANIEWHYFNEYLGTQLPCQKNDLRSMIKRAIKADEQVAQQLELPIGRKKHHFARAAGYYLAGKGYGSIRA
jgi:O-antigen biosynthesis protein